MNVFLAGQKFFGQEVLRLILALGLDVAGVSAPIPEPGGKADLLWSAAARCGLPVIPAGTLNASTLPAGVDLIVCAHSHDFIGARTRQRARLGGIGYHPSLLPLHRGRDAIYWTLRMGDLVAGGTVYWLNDKVDGGPVAARDWCFTRPGDTPRELWRRDLLPLGLRLFHRVLTDLAAGVIVAVPQDEALATWEPSVGRPPLYKPDLPAIGPPPDGFTVLASAEALNA